jgi:hypothetical protein
VNDAVRAYLGARYGFDGLESTTDEIVHALRRAQIDDLALPLVLGFCEECDLVKFANMTPSTDSCERVLDAAERIVRSTMPRQKPGPRGESPVASAPAPTPGAQAAPGDRGTHP